MNCKEEYDLTALGRAVDQSHIEVVRLLLSNEKVDVNTAVSKHVTIYI